MGRLSYSRIIIAIICFALAGALIYRQTASRASVKRSPLNRTFSAFQGWKGSGPIVLERKIVEALELDDYLDQNYSNGNKTVSLYIGYYLTVKKVGAVHSPLVCFPGQGWLILNAATKSIRVEDRNIDLSSMTVAKGEDRELILYWFQAFDKTSSGTFLQKVYTFWSKMTRSREDNAFVRVSVTLEGQSTDEAYAEAKSFIKAFYPRFLAYIKNQT